MYASLKYIDAHPTLTMYVTNKDDFDVSKMHYSLCMIDSCVLHLSLLLKM